MRPSMDYVKNITNNKPLVGLELGVREGEHAEIILKGMNLSKLYLVDIWTSYFCEGKEYDYNYLYNFINSKFGTKENVRIIQGNSLIVAECLEDNSLDFVYIDANHQYEAVKEDIKNLFPKVKLGGYICGHDYCEACSGVIKAVSEFLTDNPNYKIFVNDTDWWFKKGE